MPEKGVTAYDVTSMVQRPFSTVFGGLVRAAAAGRVRRQPGPRRGTWQHGSLPVYFQLTRDGRSWIDLQERYGAPPDPFRDPVGYARWAEETAEGRLVPMLINVDLHTGKVLRVSHRDPNMREHLVSLRGAGLTGR